jgi:hypothetical protein
LARMGYWIPPGGACRRLWTTIADGKGVGGQPTKGEPARRVTGETDGSPYQHHQRVERDTEHEEPSRDNKATKQADETGS